MWLPILLNSLNEAEMREMGMKMNLEDIYSVNNGSLKDAVVHFAGICTGEIISMEGLLLTNHHCGYGAIQSHSTLERNLLKEGYWASDKSEELPVPELYATFIVRIEDVTDHVLANLTDITAPAERQVRIDANLEAVKAAASRETYQEVLVRSFFEGTQYFLFITETYRDVRIVGVPPESIGKFGADTDNWVWPRHTGDFGLYRVYAGPDNKPAEYAPENVPLRPKHALPVSTSGVRSGDFTLVFGFPGRTDQYLTSYGVTQTIEVIDPARVGIREVSMGIMSTAMKQDEATRLRLAPLYARLANYWKKWIGERQGLIQVNAVAHKQQLEQEFSARLSQNSGYHEAYGSLLRQLQQAYEQTDSLEKARIFYREIFGINVRLFQVVSRLDRLKRIYENNGQDIYAQVLEQQHEWFVDFYDEFDPGIDRRIFAALITHMSTNLSDPYLPTELTRDHAGGTRGLEALASMIYQDPILASGLYEQIAALDGAEFVEMLEHQPAYKFYKSVQSKSDQISAAYNERIAILNDLQRNWMVALMEMFPERRFWPDANSTMRVSYGQVRGYHPRDAISYEPVTYLDGIIEKYIPGDYEFDVHPKLLQLYADRDFGPYVDAENGKVPVCFLGSNHTTGGNSGSPVIDARGNLIGINFDRVWEGTMSDLYYAQSASL
jgi:hypothetical protein